MAKNTPIKDFKKQIEKEAKKQGVECELKANKLVASCGNHVTIMMLFNYYFFFCEDEIAQKGFAHTRDSVS